MYEYNTDNTNTDNTDNTDNYAYGFDVAHSSLLHCPGTRVLVRYTYVA
jgi:hypothetical protein